MSSAAFPTPDWIHQTLWFIAGVFGTGAIWYFASQKNWLATLWTAFAAVVTCVLAVTLLIRNDLIWRERDGRENTRGQAAPTAVADRHLSLEQSNFLVASLQQFAGQPIVVGFVLGDAETQVFAQEVGQTLANAGWNIKRLNAGTTTYRGIYLSPQDPTDVPRAADFLIRAFAEQGFSVRKHYVQPNSFEYNGNEYVPTLYLTIGRNGAPTPLPERYVAPLVIPTFPRVPANLAKVASGDVVTYAHQVAAALREYEIRNRRRFEAEWRVHDDPLPQDSYRGVFERALRPPALELKEEMQRRLGIGPATVWALDADSLDGLQPLRDAANYLDELAAKLRRAA